MPRRSAPAHGGRASRLPLVHRLRRDTLSRVARVARVTSVAIALIVLAAPVAARAQDLSMHVLDLARGVGGAGVPVTLERQGPSGWQPVARAVTDTNGRVRAFPGTRPEAGTFRLVFDLRAYATRWAAAPVAAGRTSPAAGADPGRRPFFPEIVVLFEIPDTAHYHVPVVVSPFGYSTYRGN